ncbi:MAG: hypothetical protein MK101_12020, partial [Phycisphaerales bacterium]|nr:hypothetical protein [Phycisphaerales bacterium]
MRYIYATIAALASCGITGSVHGDFWNSPYVEVAASDGSTGDAFGYSVAVDGDTCVIGALGFHSVATSSAYVFTNAGGTWSQVAELDSPSGGTFSDRFGCSVALDGDTCMVGAYGVNTGRAYVYTKSGDTWSQAQELTASGGASAFGVSIAIEGDTCVIGAYGTNSYTGSAYVFTNTGGTWSQVAELTAPDGASNDGFGASVALDGDTCVISAYGDNDFTGSAYVFTKSGGTWSHVQKLTAHGLGIDSYFGLGVALDGNTCVIGASSDLQTGRGSAYVFTNTGGTWSQVQKLTPTGGEFNDNFGYSVALDGDICVIGAYGTNSTNTGSAYVFNKSGGTWSQVQKLTPTGGAIGNYFGKSVDFDGSTCVIGAPFQSPTDTGSAYLYGSPAIETGACCIGDSCDVTTASDCQGDWLGADTNCSGAPCSIAQSEAIAWGNNDFGQCNVPAGETFVQVAAGLSHTIGLRADGTAIAWGDNPTGQCNVPAGETFVEVAAGGNHNIGLRADGTAIAWGYNLSGICDIPAGETFVQVAAGGYHTIGLRADGTAIAWGYNFYGPCNVPVGETFVQVAAGNSHTIGLRADGTAIAWGLNSSGQCDIPSGEIFVEVATGGYHSIGLRADGTAIAWGSNAFGQCDIPAVETFAQIAAGHYHTIGLRADGTAIAWGSNVFGQCDIPAGETFVQVAACSEHTIGLRAGGASDSDNDGIPDSQDQCPGEDDTIDTDVDGTPDCLDGCPNDPDKIAPGVCGCGEPDIDSDGDGTFDCDDGCPNDPLKTEPGACGCGVTDADDDANGTPDCLEQPCNGDTDQDGIVDIVDLLNVISDWGECEQPMSIYSAEAWGKNDYGQSVVPVNQEFVQVAVGREHSLGLRADGTAIAWGSNAYGACDVPVVNFTQVSAGGNHSLGLRSDGTTLAWGQNYYGQCDVPAGESFVQVVAGHAHSSGLRADGTAIGWGLNNFGQCDVPAGET